MSSTTRELADEWSPPGGRQIRQVSPPPPPPVNQRPIQTIDLNYFMLQCVWHQRFPDSGGQWLHPLLPGGSARQAAVQVLYVRGAAGISGSQILVASGSILEVQPDKLQFRYRQFTLEVLLSSTRDSQILMANSFMLFYLEVLPDKLQFRQFTLEALQASALPRFWRPIAPSSSIWRSSPTSYSSGSLHQRRCRRQRFPDSDGQWLHPLLPGDSALQAVVQILFARCAVLPSSSTWKSSPKSYSSGSLHQRRCRRQRFPDSDGQWLHPLLTEDPARQAAVQEVYDRVASSINPQRFLDSDGQWLHPLLPWDSARQAAVQAVSSRGAAGISGSQILMANGSMLFSLEVQADQLVVHLFYLEVQPDQLQFRYCMLEALQASAVPRF